MKKMKSAVPADLLPSIGLVTVNYRLLEMHLEVGIWQLLGVGKMQNIGKIVTADLTFSKLINLIGSLHNELCKNVNMRNEFQQLLIEIKNISAERNNIIHTISGLGKDGKALMLSAKMRSPKGIKLKISHASKEEFEKVANSISEVAFKLISFVLNKDFPTFSRV